jgi:hypothetical protein
MRGLSLKTPMNEIDVGVGKVFVFEKSSTFN